MGACRLPHHSPVLAAPSAQPPVVGAPGDSKLSENLALGCGRSRLPLRGPLPSPRRSSSGTGGGVEYRYSCFFQTVPLQGQIGHQLLQLYVLSPERLYLLLRGVRTMSRVKPLLPAS